MAENISIDIKDNRYVLSGDLESVLENKRILLSLKRLHFMENEGLVEIPFEPKTKIITLQGIQSLLERFGFSIDLRESVREEESAYHNEQENFKLFSENAKKIRNDEFSDNIELVKSFKNFKEVLEKQLARKLYPLQMLSAFHMAFSQHACNFAVPGSGKTSIVYGAYAYLRSLPADNTKHVDKILVIGPLSSFAPWEKEYEHCFGKEAESQRLSGDQKLPKRKKEQHLYSSNPEELTLISHKGVEGLERGVVDFLRRNKAMVVVDEAHRVKNPEGIWGKSVVRIAEEATSRIVLTGTPAPNGYEDLYNLFQFLYPFKFQDILRIHYGQLKDLTNTAVSDDDQRVQDFVENIKPYFIRIKKSDLNLPRVEEHVIPVTMDSNHKDIYDFVERKHVGFFKSNPSLIFKDVFKSKLIRLRQAATNPSLLLRSLQDALENSEYGEDPNLHFASINDESIDDSVIFKKIIEYEESGIPQKFVEIKELLESKILPNGEKAIIWTIFIQNAEELEEYLGGYGIESRLLIGRVPQSERESIVENFNDPYSSDFRVVIANPFSVSESISLHNGCHNAIYMERDYNAASFLQSKDRIHRVGLANNVVTNYFYLISDESIDSVIDNKLNLKVKRMEKIIDQEIPLFNRINDLDETDIITSLLEDYARRN